MYQRFCERHGLTWEPLSLSEGTLGGLKEAVVAVRGDGHIREAGAMTGEGRQLPPAGDLPLLQDPVLPRRVEGKGVDALLRRGLVGRGPPRLVPGDLVAVGRGFVKELVDEAVALPPLGRGRVILPAAGPCS